MKAMTCKTEEQWAQAVLLFILALALALRAAGAFVYPHVDETINARIVGNMLRDGNPNPQFFNYPSLVLYVQAAVRIFIGNQPVDYFAVTRMVASMAATASVFVVYCTARKLLRSVAAALFAAAVTAVCPLHVDMSPMVTVDIFVAVFSACAMYFCVRLYESGRVKDYLLAGACVGLAAGSKYTGVVFFCGVLVAHVLHHEAWRQILRAAGKPVLSMLTMVVTFLVTTPYALFDSKTFFAHVAYEGNHYRVGHGACIIDFSCTRSWGRYADVLVSDYGLGLIFCILALLALVLALRSFRTGGYSTLLLVLAFPLTLIIFVGYYRAYFSRNIVGAIPGLALAAGAGAQAVGNAVTKRTGKLWLGHLLMAAIFIAGARPLLQRDAAIVKNKNLVNTVQVLAVWVHENLPQNSVLAVPDADVMKPDYGAGKKTIPFRYLVRAGRLALPREYDFVVTYNDGRECGLYRKPDGSPKTERVRKEAEVCNAFYAAHERVYEIRPRAGVVSGPGIRVYRKAALHSEPAQ